MPQITIDGVQCEFSPGEMILQIANRNGIEIPQYCYHDGLSVVASCRICLAEVWAPNPRNDNKLEPIPKLLPTCQTTATDGQVVYTTTPKAIANQKAVMEYLLINHPLDCPVCDQAGECFLQDYSYEYGRGVSRFEEEKVKQPKKNLGDHVYLYADRCIMCTRCVRFAREVTGTSELIVQGRGNNEQIDIFPGEPLNNELSANVIDLCPVGALLDKDFLFTQRVWFLKSTPSIDGITAQGDNITVEHNNGKVYRIKPRTNAEVNKWWISDEIRYGYHFVAREDRLTTPMDRTFSRLNSCDWGRAYNHALKTLNDTSKGGLLLMVSPMLACEEAYALAQAARAIDPSATLAVGPVPTLGEDKSFPGGYTIRAEKAPNARGVRRVLESFGGSGGSGGEVLDYAGALDALKANRFGRVILTGNYPSDWVTDELVSAVEGKALVLIDTLPSRLMDHAQAVLPGAAWVEKAGTFENVDNRLQAFEAAIPTPGSARSEGQIGMDLFALATGAAQIGDAPETVIARPDSMPGQVGNAFEVAAPIGELYNAAMLRQRMADDNPQLAPFTTEVHTPRVEARQEADMAMVEL